MENASESNRDSTSLTCLLRALEQVQSTVRAYDTKTQIASIGFIFSIGLVRFLVPEAAMSMFAPSGRFIWGFAISIVPIIMFGHVLFPRFNPVRRSEVDTNVLKNVYTFGTNPERTVDEYLRDIDGANWKREIAIEIIEASFIRDIKRRRFLIAMYVAGVSYAAMFVAALILNSLA